MQQNPKCSSFHQLEDTEASGDGKEITPGCTCAHTTYLCYLVKRANSRLKDQVSVEEEGAQERLRVGRQLGQDARQQQVDMKRVRRHVLQTRQQHTDKWSCREKNHKQSFNCMYVLGNSEAAAEQRFPFTYQ